MIINELETKYMKFLEMPSQLDDKGDSLSTIDIKEGRLKIISEYLQIIKQDPFVNVDVIPTPFLQINL